MSTAGQAAQPQAIGLPKMYAKEVIEGIS